MSKASISKETMKFLSDLKRHNDRAWFQENKERYAEASREFYQFISDLTAALGKIDPTLKKEPPEKAIFRIYRDVRFSREKTPYKTHFGAFIAVGGRKSRKAGFYIHLEPGDCMVGGGIYHPEKDALMMLRDAVAKNGKQLKAIISKPEFKKVYPQMDGDRSKTIPRGYPKDHPMAELLKFKDFIVSKPVSDKELLTDAIGACVKYFKVIYPFNKWLSACV